MSNFSQKIDIDCPYCGAMLERYFKMPESPGTEKHIVRCEEGLHSESCDQEFVIELQLVFERVNPPMKIEGYKEKDASDE